MAIKHIICYLLFMGNSVFITIQNEDRICSAIESKQEETVLSSFIRAGISVSAPCGGRGICRRCVLKLLKGKVRLKSGLKNGAEISPGDSFPACQAFPLSDITVARESVLSAPLSVMQKGKMNSRPDGVKRAGAALDIGTTALQAYLIDLDTGEFLDTYAALNDQRSFGADVMSRISAAKNGKLDELFFAVNRQTEKILAHFISKWNLDGIEQCSVSGNTVMLHIFCRADPCGMGEAPYTPLFLEERHFNGSELSISARRITLLPGISAFMGADITAGLAFIDIMNKKENSLFIDIGTNGEMAAWIESEKRLLCCSAAAGPCFEQAHISCGMSGSDFIDTIALMIRKGVIDKTGALAEQYLEPALGGFKTDIPGGIVTQKDVREFQLAKSALYSGIITLCDEAGFKPRDIGSVYIAGAFGFYINLENAVRTGLFPRFFSGGAEDKNPAAGCAVCGNTSLMGAATSVTDPSFLQRCRGIIERCSIIDLAKSPVFAREFAANMWF